MYKIEKHYRTNDALRRSFNDLARTTFGLDFEPWYRNGFWGDAYDPYSIVLDGKVVANVSVNRTDMVIGGQRRRLYQLGTVMTAPEYRNRGLIRVIMAEIEQDTADADGVYLFANDGVLEFYPKFGFTRSRETICTKAVSQAGPCTAENVPMDGPEAWARLAAAMEANTFSTACQMVDNPGLIFFYASQFLSGCVYRLPETDAWVIAEQEDDELLIHNVFSKAPITLDAIIAAFGSSVRHVTLGFSPADATGFKQTPLEEEDCTFFVKGRFFNEFRDLRIPSLSHA